MAEIFLVWIANTYTTKSLRLTTIFFQICLKHGTYSLGKRAWYNQNWERFHTSSFIRNLTTLDKFWWTCVSTCVALCWVWPELRVEKLRNKSVVACFFIPGDERAVNRLFGIVYATIFVGHSDRDFKLILIVKNCKRSSIWNGTFQGGFNQINIRGRT